jgi:DNA-binding transcriptional LysR family regulator
MINNPDIQIMNQIRLLPALITFSEVALQGSFTKAAKLLGLSKSGVSQQITKLEQELGVQLLKRNTRGLSVTTAGEKLLKRCELLKGQVDNAFLELANTEQQAKGKFSVIFPHPLEKNIIIPALSQLCREYPGLEPNIIVTLEKRDLVKNKLDVAIFGGEPKDSDYRALPLAKTCEYFCATPEYIYKNKAPKNIEELEQHSWIANEWQINPIQLSEEKDPSQKIQVKLNEFARVNAVSSTLMLTLEHLGISLLPNIICSPLVEQGKLVRVLPQYKGPEWPFHFIHPYKGEKPIHVTRFYQLVKHYFSTALLSVSK